MVYCSCVDISTVSFAQAGFIEQPEVVDFEVTVLGGPTLAGLIPSLKAWLIRFARDAIISHYVLPEQWCFRLDPVTHTALSCCSLCLHYCTRKRKTVLAHLRLLLLAFLVVVHHIHTRHLVCCLLLLLLSIGQCLVPALGLLAVPIDLLQHLQ